MQTQISCSRCGTPYVADIHQVIDVGQQPQMKIQLLNGALNVGVCPRCGTATQVSSPLVYHDPAHELFMIYVPPEANFNQKQREEMIGRFTRQVMEATPQEQRRAYLFQPQMVLTLPTFMEKVLETEGITKEMIDRQRRQIELLQTLADAGSDVADRLIKERAGEIDEEFFAILQSYVENASRLDDDKHLLPLINLRAKLMTNTAIGRQIEKRQVALHKLSQEAKKQGGLTPALLLKHIQQHQKNMQVVEILAMSGQSALTYQFFQLLTAEIEKLEKAKDKAAVVRLTEIRRRLLELQEAVRKQSEQIITRAEGLLQQIMAAEDKEAAVINNLNRMDDAFMYVLSNRIAQADQRSQTKEAQALNQIYDFIIQQTEQHAPPEVQLLNDLLEAETEMERTRLLDDHQELLSAELVQVVDMLQERAGKEGQPEMGDRLRHIKAMIQGRLNDSLGIRGSNSA
jgi:hypothetical protein